MNILNRHTKLTTPKTLQLILVCGLLLLSVAGDGQAQFMDYNHPELEWKTLTAEHFVAHYHNGTEYTARTALAIAEDIYDPVTKLYQYEPDGKIHLVIRDHDDYSNGGAWYYDNKIEIWAKPLDFALRGTHHWLYDVVTHEFTHMIQLGAARTGPRWMPAMYFQFIGYEPEKRPDVLLGYPNAIGSFPVAGTIVPMWFAEGTAQYQTRDMGHDWWDAHRDMHLRTRVLSDNLLTYTEMGVFGKNSLDAESVYNHGYGLVRYIADTYGDDKLRELTARISRPDVISFSSACRHVLGVSGSELHEQWKQHLTEMYTRNMETIRENLITGDLIYKGGFANLYPAFMPDGKSIAFMTNNGQDYMSLSRLLFYDIEKDSIISPGSETEKPHKFIEGQYLVPGMGVTESESPVKGDFDFSPNGNYIVFSRRSSPNIYGSHYYDIYLWDMENELEIRVTEYARLSNPAFHPDGKRIVAVHQADGTNNLVEVTLPDPIGEEKDISDHTEIEFLTHFGNGTQIFRPIYAPDGNSIYCAMIDLEQRDIYRYDLTKENWKDAWQPVITGVADDRDVVPTASGEHLVFSSDRTGIFNIYLYDIETTESVPLTNVIGGAFMPDINEQGCLVYSEFEDGGYRIRRIKDPQPVDEVKTVYVSPEDLERPDLEPTPYFEGRSKDYPTPFNKLFIIPRIAWDYGIFKPGFYAFTNDLLNRINLFTGAAFGEKGDRDLYLNGEYKMLYPTFYLEAFNIVRHENQTFDDQFKIIGEKLENGIAVPIYDTYSVDYRFELLETDLGLKLPLFDFITAKAAYRYGEYKAVMRFDDGATFDYKYHKGSAFLLNTDVDLRAPNVASDIHPQGGYRGWLEIAYEHNRFLDGFVIESEKGTIQEVYKHYKYLRIETDIDYYWKFYKSLVLNPRIIAGGLTEPVDPFYNMYAGGLPGLRGYSFYSIGGTKKAVGRLSLRFPIASNIDLAWGPFYFDRVAGSVFAETGDAWTDQLDIGEIKNDVGAELRFKFFSWYGYPTDLQVAAAYGLNKFSIIDDRGGINEYGNEWRWYFTLLFDFI